MKLCVIEGDGVGRDVVPQAVRVLKHILPEIELVYREAGWDTFEKTGTSLPQDTLDTAREAGAVLFGAAASPSYYVENYSSPKVRLRQYLNTFYNVRPVRYYPVPTARRDIDLMVIRQTTEDFYVPNAEQTQEDRATATRYITIEGTEQFVRAAFELAAQQGRQEVTIVHKANILPETDGLFRRIALKVCQDFPQIRCNDMLVDTAAYWMVKDPTRFDVIVTLNLYGDILSDMAAAWGGGLGMVPALNLGGDIAIAEPVHGTAPELIGTQRANPTAIILSTALLLRYHWQRNDLALQIETAVNQTLQNQYFTADIDSANFLLTHEFTDYVLEFIDNPVNEPLS